MPRSKDLERDLVSCRAMLTRTLQRIKDLEVENAALKERYAATEAALRKELAAQGTPAKE